MSLRTEWEIRSKLEWVTVAWVLQSPVPIPVCGGDIMDKPNPKLLEPENK